MKFLTKTILAATLVAAGAAYAEGSAATNADVIARQELMKSFGGAAKVLGGMASGEMAHDAAAAEAAKKALVDGAAMIEAKFTTNAEDPGSKSQPAVWTNWDDFLAKGKALGDAAAALDVASAESIGAGMAGVGGSCKGCHTDYRMQ